MTFPIPQDATILNVEGRWRNADMASQFVELDTDYMPELLDLSKWPELLAEDKLALSEYAPNITYDYRVTYVTDAGETIVEVDVREHG